jgi:hypothetical protein
MTRVAQGFPPPLGSDPTELRRGSPKHDKREGGSPASFALGFRVKSGYAIAVALGGSSSLPGVLVRRVVTLSDPAVAETRQPYHDGFFKQQDDPREIARRLKIVKRCAKQSVDALLEDSCFAGLRCRRAGLVVGSVIDPRKVGNPHIRAHASEGRLFRTVLEEALRSHGVGCDVIVEKQLAAKAAADLGRQNTDIARAIAGFGRTLGGAWRADEKAACVAAWLAL